MLRKYFSTVPLLLFIGLNLLLGLEAFCGMSISANEYYEGVVTLCVLILCCMFFLPNLFLYLICKAVREKNLSKKEKIAAAVFAPFLVTLIFGMYFAGAGVSFMFSPKSYGLGAFLMGAMSGFIITIIGAFCVVMGIAVIQLFKNHRPMLKKFFCFVFTLIYDFCQIMAAGTMLLIVRLRQMIADRKTKP
ncbi:MAG: hypothetical protein K6B74_04830 [Ruminococcus sp.]|nr:hypothetical protein [Ruminococcus sp.]